MSTDRASINFTTYLAAIFVIKGWYWAAIVFAFLWFLEICVNAYKKVKS